VRNARSTAVDGRIGGPDPPRLSGGLPGRYGHRLLPMCCPTAPTLTFGDHNPNRPFVSSQLPERDAGERRGAEPLVTVGDCSCPYWTVAVRPQRGTTVGRAQQIKSQ
jgi:hypothetical protein